jgi:hypothetical protein
MLARALRSWLIALPLAMLGVSILASSSSVGIPNAWAQRAPSSTSVQQRVRELEERLKILELEHEALQRRMQLAAEHDNHILDDLDKRLRTCEQTAKAPSKSVAVPAAKASASRGSTNCDPPWSIDLRGVRTIQPACLQSLDATEDSCELPYYIDQTGLRRFKPECI